MPDLHYKHSCDFAIIGAGVAGASIAALLGERGYKIFIIEKDTLENDDGTVHEPDRIVGELMQPAGVESMRKLGLEEVMENIDSPEINGYGVFNCEGKKIVLQYPKSSDRKIVGHSFHHGRFIRKLRERVRKCQNVLMMQGTAEELIVEKDRVRGFRYTHKRDEIRHEIRAHTTIVVDGLYSKFRTQLTTHKAKSFARSRFMGVILRINNEDLPLPNMGHVLLAKPSPILCYPISSTEARLLVDFPGDLPPNRQSTRQYLEHKIKPQMPPQIQPALQNAIDDPLSSFRSMPNSSMPARPVRSWKGVVMFGDALNMRHPLTGGGMTVAFTDILHFIELLDTRMTADRMSDPSSEKILDDIITQLYNDRSGENAVINILADALYDIFCNHENGLADACYAYLGLGGEFSAGPIRLLSGVSRSLPLLLYHFFSVALFAVYFLLKPIPTPSRIYRCVQTFRTAVGIIIPRLARESDSLVVRGACKTITTLFWV